METYFDTLRTKISWVFKIVENLTKQELNRKIIGGTITKCLKNELMSLGSNYQLCLGQNFGIESAIHALRGQYSKNSADAVLPIDAKNAFNSPNWKLVLKNIENTCPYFLTAIKNLYSNHLKCSLTKQNIHSPERTTQGELPAIPCTVWP